VTVDTADCNFWVSICVAQRLSDSLGEERVEHIADRIKARPAVDDHGLADSEHRTELYIDTPSISVAPSESHRRLATGPSGAATAGP
jgi:hypothetical protein